MLRLGKARRSIKNALIVEPVLALCIQRFTSKLYLIFGNC
jgi:hypothetical protein